jgi:phosphopantetheine adenylyltransferase
MSAVTSTIVREIIRYGGNAKMFLPAKMVID